MSDGKKVVWIVGAGFSCSLGAPLLAESFSPEALQNVLATYPKLKESLIRYSRT
jgi:hypothetical protein